MLGIVLERNFMSQNLTHKSYIKDIRTHEVMMTMSRTTTTKKVRGVVASKYSGKKVFGAQKVWKVNSKDSNNNVRCYY